MPELDASAWVFLLVSGVFALVGFRLVWRGLAGQARSSPHCPKCWYDLRAQVGLDGLEKAHQNLPVTCPECGRVVRKARHLFRPRRRLVGAMLGLMLLAAVWYGFEVRYRVVVYGEPVLSAIVPSTAWVVLMGYRVDSFDHGQKLFRFNANEPKRIRKYDLWKWQHWLLARSIASQMTGDEKDRVDEANRWLENLTDPLSSTSAFDDDTDAESEPDVDELDETEIEVHKARKARNSALKALRELDAALNKSVWPSVERALVGLLDHPSPAVRAQALDSLQWALKHRMLGEETVRKVRGLVADADDDVRYQALDLLSLLGRAPLKELSDPEFCKLLTDAARSRGGGEWMNSLLLEAIARGKPCLPTIEALWQDRASMPDDDWRQIEMLTTLRRLQGHPDPIRIEPANDPPFHTVLDGNYEQLYIKLRMVNTDVLRSTVDVRLFYLEDGESGKWDHEITDQKGETTRRLIYTKAFVPPTDVRLAPGEWVDVLFHVIPYDDTPGDYSVRFVYNTQANLPWVKSLDDWVVLRSVPVPLTISKPASPDPLPSPTR